MRSKKIICLLCFLLISCVLSFCLSGCSDSNTIEGKWFISDFLNEDGNSELSAFEGTYKLSPEFMVLVYQNGIVSSLNVSKDGKFAADIGENEIVGSWETSITTNDEIDVMYSFVSDKDTYKVYTKKGDIDCLFFEMDDAIFVLSKKEKNLELAQAQFAILEENELNWYDYIFLIDDILSINPNSEITDNIEDMIELKEKTYYDYALSLMDEEKYEDAITILEQVSDYSNALDKIEESKELINKREYDEAVELMDSEEYGKAINKFKSLGKYSDSEDKITECKELINQNNYDNAIESMESGHYEKAIKKFKELNGFADSQTKIEECEELLKKEEYNNALSFMNEGNYKDAIELFEKIVDYEDSKDNIIKCKKGIINNSKIGDIVTFGNYEQDNKPSTEFEPIEWIVIEKNDNLITLMSKYAIDSQVFNDAYEDITWDICTLRHWLNDDFYNVAFNDDEKQVIATTKISADKNPKYETETGNDVEDKVYLLSVDEFITLLELDEMKNVEPTTFAAPLKKWISDKDTFSWWLRSPGGSEKRAVCVKDGSVFYYGEGVSSYCYVRPVITLNLE